MNNPVTDMNAASRLNEALATDAFSTQSAVFDKLYSGDLIIQYKRKRVRDHAERYLQPRSRILELNAGTGDDAIYFAGKGHEVHATDIAPGMQAALLRKVKQAGLEHAVTNELCSFTELQHLSNKGPYDLVFSNFAGLNCTDRLDLVLHSLNDLLKPGGLITLVVLPKLCLWETLLVFRGRFRTATRRFFSSKGASSRVEGKHFRCWYYQPSYITGKLRGQFELVSLEGLCTLVPPSYIEGFAEKYPAAFGLLSRAENKLKSKWPWKYLGDYFIITMRKRGPAVP